MIGRACVPSHPGDLLSTSSSNAEERSELSAPMRFGLTRRRMLRGAGMGGAAALLAACGVKGTGDQATTNAPTAGSTSEAVPGSPSAESSPSATSSAPGAPTSAAPSSSASAPATSRSLVPDTSDADKKLTWSNWPEYIDTAEDNVDDHPSLTEFTKKTGITVDYAEDINDNDQFFAKIQPQLASGKPIAQDVFVVTDWMVARLIRLGYLAPWDHALMPNLKNLSPGLLDVPFDPGRQFSMTWQSGLTGIASNTKALGGKKIESMDQLLTDPALRGKVTLLTEMQDTVGMVMFEMGADPSNFTDAQFDAAMKKLQAAVDAKQIRQFTGNDYGKGLAKGDIAAALAWTGDVVQLQADNPDLVYTLPEAGYLLWSDNMVIPYTSPHRKAVHQLMDHYYSAEAAASVAAWVNYVTPVPGAKAVLEADDPEIANNELIFPSAETLAKAKVFMGTTAEQEKRYLAAFAKLTEG